jgi:hypothetical protein
MFAEVCFIWRRCEASGKSGRSVNVFWTSRNNKGHAKIISGDILNYKKTLKKRHYHLTRRHFSRE